MVKLRRRLRAVALVVPTLLVGAVLGAPAVSAVPAPTLVVGLYGTGDPTFDGVYRQSLAILGLHAAGRAPRPEAVQWLLDQQCPDGSFTSYRAGTSCAPFDPVAFTGGPDSNATAMAVQALASVGTPVARAAGFRAALYLRGVQQADGGWEYTPLSGNGTDPNSTGLVLMALRTESLAPAQDVTTYYQGLQVGWTDFAGHVPATDRGGISTPWNPGTPNLLATVQSVPGLRGASLTRRADFSTAWQDGPTAYAALPEATDDGVGGWAASYLVGAVTAAGPAAFAAADPTSAAWTVLSLSADRTGETAARAVADALLALPATTSPAANAQDALAAAAVGRSADVATYADRLEASLTRDTVAPTSTWRGGSTSVWTGQPFVLTRTALGDNFWRAPRLVQVVRWGDGSATSVPVGTGRLTHRYAAAGTRTVTVTVVDPSGNHKVTTAGTVVVRLDATAPTVRLAAPANPTARSSWRTVSATAADSQSGVAGVRLRVSQKVSGAWRSWNGTRWVAGTTAWFGAARVAGTSRWSAALPPLRLGPLVVTARSVDRSGHLSAPSSASTTLRS